MLSCKGPSGPDGFGILGYQTFHIHFCPAVMDPQEISTGFKSLRKVYLVFIFSSAAVNRYSRYDGGAKVVQDGTRPYLLYDILIFFGVERFQAQRIFQVTECIFFAPSEVVQVFEILKVEFKFREVCYDVLKTSG